MVSSPNAYWLSFFIKRGINVFCWNYREYGKSKQGCFSQYISPYNSKLDAERILEYLINKLQVRGKIGVYGRSIGGITSCHLANKFPKIIKAAIIDRTFSELDQVSMKKYLGKCTLSLYNFICGWKTLNDTNFLEAECFKILTCDPKDDVVENYAALNCGVASKLAKNQYKEEKWRVFFQCLCMVYDIEERLYEKLDQSEKNELQEKLKASFADSNTKSMTESQKNNISNSHQKSNDIKQKSMSWVDEEKNLPSM